MGGLNSCHSNSNHGEYWSFVGPVTVTVELYKTNHSVSLQYWLPTSRLVHPVVKGLSRNFVPSPWKPFLFIICRLLLHNSNVLSKFTFDCISVFIPSSFLFLRVCTFWWRRYFWVLNFCFLFLALWPLTFLSTTSVAYCRLGPNESGCVCTTRAP